MSTFPPITPLAPLGDESSDSSWIDSYNQATDPNAVGIESILNPYGARNAPSTTTGTTTATPATPSVDNNTFMNNLLGGGANGYFSGARTSSLVTNLLSSRFVFGVVGVLLIAVGGFGFDKVQDIVVSAGKKAAEGVAAT